MDINKIMGDLLKSSDDKTINQLLDLKTALRETPDDLDVERGMQSIQDFILELPPEKVLETVKQIREGKNKKEIEKKLLEYVLTEFGLGSEELYALMVVAFSSVFVAIFMKVLVSLDKEQLKNSGISEEELENMKKEYGIK